MLTTHLNSTDFFDTREYPTAKFESTRIVSDGGAAEAGKSETAYTITGNLTMLAATKEFSFPAAATIGDDDLTLRADFTIDRAEFGMDRLQEGVEKVVQISVVVGDTAEGVKDKTGGEPGNK
jgi:polyisoprenoid-binding protein YceI